MVWFWYFESSGPSISFQEPGLKLCIAHMILYNIASWFVSIGGRVRKLHSTEREAKKKKLDFLDRKFGTAPSVALGVYIDVSSALEIC